MSKKTQNPPETPCCPLCGELPFIPYHEDNPVVRLIEVIKDARKIWFAENISKGVHPSFPDPSELPSYPADLINAARNFFETPPNDLSDLFYPIRDRKHPAIVAMIEQYLVDGDRTPMLTPLCFCIAIRAIKTAWDAFCKMNEKNPLILEDVLRSENILASAKQKMATEQGKLSRQYGHKKKAPILLERNKKILADIEEVKKRNKELKDNSAAGILEKNNSRGLKQRSIREIARRTRAIDKLT